MQDIDISLLKHRSLRGIVALTTRTFVLQIISLAATLLLTIFLTPSVFGIFYVVSAIISFLGYFSDIGLAAALIQKKETLTDEDLVTTFTIQQILVVTLVCVSLLFSAQIANFYSLDFQGVLLLRALVIAFFLSSLKTIPSVLLERKLEFQKLILPQIFETLGFYVVAVVLAWLGFGIASFTWAVLVRAVVGLLAIYIVSPWKPSLGYSKTQAARLMRFGLPFQLNSFLALVKDDLFTVFLGKILPFAEIGYIGWAKKWAEVPLRLIMDSVVRVTFPAFSRIQHDKEFLTRAIETTLFGLSITIFPITIALIYGIEPLVMSIPRYGKWEPALMSFYLFAISSAVAALNSPLTNALNAIGRIKTTLMLMIMWTSLTWILSVLFIHLFGFNGFALSLLIISLTIVVVIKLMQQIAHFSFWRSIRAATFCASVQFTWYALAWLLHIHFLPLVIVWGSVGVILYCGLILTIERNKTQELIKYFLPGYVRS
jgi:PST family polysaccharide transporter